MATWNADQITQRFPFLWALLTATYAFAVAYRALVYHLAPSAPTYAGLSAVAAVWLDFYTFFNSRPLARAAVVVALLATTLFNIEIITSDTLHRRAFPIGRLAFTLIFAILLYEKTRSLIARRRHA